MKLANLILPTAIVFSSLAFTAVQAQEEWLTITAVDELRQLISGRTLVSARSESYFRADGVMAYSRNNFPSIRGWAITDDGQLCYFVYPIPERIIDCEVIQRTAVEPFNYRLKSAANESPFEFSEPAQSMVDAVSKRAGPE